MRFTVRAGLLLLPAIGGGCFRTTVSSIGPGALPPVAAGALEVRDTDGKPVRIDESAYLRFHRRDGSITPWVSARDVLVSDDGVLVDRRIPLHEIAHLRISGMERRVAGLLEQVFPPGVTLRPLDAGTVDVEMNEEVTPFTERFVLAVARSYAADPPGLSNSLWNDRAQRHLREVLHGAPLGTWRFFTPRGVSDPVSGDALFALFDHGVPYRDGIRWVDVASTEVGRHDVDPGRTTVAVVGGVATVAAVAVLYSVAGLALLVLGRGLPGNVNVPVNLPIGGPSLGDSDEAPHTEGLLWRPGDLLPAAGNARPLLSRGGAR